MATYVDGIKELQNNNIDKGIEILDEVSKKGDYHASYQLAQMYNQGLMVKKDVNLASEYFDVAFRQLNEAETTNETNYYLGLFYSFGLGTVSKDEVKAFELFEKGANNNDINAIIMYARCLLIGAGCEADVNKAFTYLDKAKDSKNPIAYKLYADCLLNGLGTEANGKEAVKYYEKAVETGDVESLFVLGTLYHEGRGVEVDEKKSFEYFEKASKYNYPEAFRNLAFFYGQGIYVTKDLTKEAEYMKKYADTGSVKGMFIYGTMCLDNTHRLFKYLEGLEYLKRAVSLQDPSATLYMGRIFEFGSFGVFMNKKVAFNHYLTAYNLGEKSASKELFRCYKFGVGVDQNAQKAAEFEEIAENLEKSVDKRA